MCLPTTENQTTFTLSNKIEFILFPMNPCTTVLQISLTDWRDRFQSLEEWILRALCGKSLPQIGLIFCQPRNEWIQEGQWTIVGKSSVASVIYVRARIPGINHCCQSEDILIFCQFRRSFEAWNIYNNPCSRDLNENYYITIRVYN